MTIVRAEVPKLTRVQLEEHVANKFDKPFTDDWLTNPMAEPLTFLYLENEGLAKWGGYVASNLNQGFGGSDTEITVEQKVFNHSFIAAYELIRQGYVVHGLELPTIATPPDCYSWLGFTESPTIGEIYRAYNARQPVVRDEYRDYLYVLQAWGIERMSFNIPSRVGTTAIAGAEVYIAFRDHQEVK